jgi:hypothetical protein
MLPDSEHSPTVATQGAIHLPVSLLIPGEFVAPIGSALFDMKGMFWTSMPETAVHENGGPKPPENKIGFAWHFSMPLPAADAMRAEKFGKCLLRFLISARTDARHPFRSLQSGKKISHARKLP